MPKLLPLIAALALAAGLASIPPAKADSRGVFIAACTYDHRLSDDPIVFPGQPGAAHSHEFLGNTSTDAFSTAESLATNTKLGTYNRRYPGTTCGRAGDKSGYWTPTLHDGRVSYPPVLLRAYYRDTLGSVALATKIRPFPPGLRMIAGDATSTVPQSLKVADWSCQEPGPVANVNYVPTCQPGSKLKLRLHFPQCWNGRDLDSPDHKSHMAYAGSRGACPTTHPVLLPQLTTTFHYKSTGGPGTMLASGSANSAHADFFNGWDANTQLMLVEGCLKVHKDCDVGAGGTPSYSNVPATLPLPVH